MALIPFPPSAQDAPMVHAALGGIPPSRWTNPDHITDLLPAVIKGPEDVELVADVKIEGVPQTRWKLGRYPDSAAAEAAWDEYVAYLMANLTSTIMQRLLELVTPPAPRQA